MNQTQFIPGEDKQSMAIKRTFNAPIADVWQAWTTRELLEKWWAPKPWQAVTKEFNFSEKGRWLYAMNGPEGEKHWAVEEYLEIKPQQSFIANDYFTDETGTPNLDMPSNRWKVEFLPTNGQTELTVNLTTKSPQDLEKLTEMGFKEGFTQGLDQLDALLSA